MRITKRLVGAVVLAAILGTAVSESRAVSVNIVTNGSFELPPIVGNFATEPPGSPDGWDVLGPPTSHSIDQIAAYWRADDGSQSLDMNGFYLGVIGQALTVIPGQTYSLKFAMSGNPAGGPSLKTMQVDVIPLASPNSIPTPLPFTPDMDPVGTDSVGFAGVTAWDYRKVFSYDVTAKGNSVGSDGDMKWDHDSDTFIASTSSVYLQFTSRTVGDSGNAQYPNAFGPALDTVSVIPVPLPAAAGVGFSTLGGFGMLAGLKKVCRRKGRIA